MSAPRCPITVEFLGIPMGPCVNDATTRVTLTCDYGCPREPIRICDWHVNVIAADDPAACCQVCDSEGRPDSQVHLVSAVPIGATS